MASERKVEGWVIARSPDSFDFYREEWRANVIAAMDGPGAHRVRRATLTVHEDQETPE